MVQSAVLGFPRMGAARELKKANEAYWGDKLSRDELLKEGKRLRLEHWKIQKDAGVDIIPSNDFAFYGKSALSTSPLFPAVGTSKNTGDGREFGGLILPPLQTRFSITSSSSALSRSVTPSTSSTPSMSTSPWVVVSRRRVSMSPLLR